MYWRHQEGTVKTMILGRDGDVSAVRYLYGYLCREVDRLAEEGWSSSPQVGSSRSWKNAFRVSAAYTIKRRLVESRHSTLEFAAREAENDPAASRGLVRIRQNEAEIEARHRALNLRTARAASFSSVHGAHAGRRAGERIDLGADRKRLGSPSQQLDSNDSE
jgi:hypothetical protein